MNQYIIHTGWKLKPEPIPYILYAKDHKSREEEILDLIPGNIINLIIENYSRKFCVGFSESSGNRVPCPRAMELDVKRNQCQFCSLNEFYLCRMVCQGDFCHPSSEEAREYCWNTKVCVYLTHIAGKVKVGSSTNPFRRWLGQGSDAGICIAEGVGLQPRALEHRIGQNPSFPLAIRVNQKMKYLGSSPPREQIKSDIFAAVEEIYSTVKSDILIQQEKLDSIAFLDIFHGNIPKIDARPIIKEPTDEKFTFGGEIIGVKGSILVVKNKQTYYALNLLSLIGSYVTLSDIEVEMKGQKSLFDFV